MLPTLIGTVVIAGLVGFFAEKSGFTRNGYLASIIICVDTSSYSYRGLSQGKYFAVNLLTADQANIAELFASKTEDKFQQCQYVVGAKGLLLIQDTLASLICQRSFTATHGDHAVVIGDVIDGTVTDCDPLVHWRRSFHRMTDTRNR